MAGQRMFLQSFNVLSFKLTKTYAGPEKKKLRNVTNRTDGVFGRRWQGGLRGSVGS